MSIRPDQLLRHSLDGQVKARLGDRRRRLQIFREPEGDPGWFGPDSITWKVHSRLGPMLVGGLSALMLQTLHPLVVQGVADHSNYREDPFGRLQRTADFIALTTYGSDAVAAQAVQSVRTIHGRVRGTTASGERYRATDPELLTYVHVTEVWGFLRAYQRYSQHPLLMVEKDRYLAETSVVARRLGAKEVPRSVDEVRAYLRRLRPQLRRGPEAERIVRFLVQPPRQASWLERVAYRTVIEAGIDLLPGFARRDLGFVRPPGFRLAAVRPAAALLSEALHWSVGEAPMLAAARERVGAALGQRGLTMEFVLTLWRVKPGGVDDFRQHWRASAPVDDSCLYARYLTESVAADSLPYMTWDLRPADGSYVPFVEVAIWRDEAAYFSAMAPGDDMLAFEAERHVRMVLRPGETQAGGLVLPEP